MRRLPSCLSRAAAVGSNANMFNTRCSNPLCTTADSTNLRVSLIYSRHTVVLLMGNDSSLVVPQRGSKGQTDSLVQQAAACHCRTAPARMPFGCV